MCKDVTISSELENPRTYLQSGEVVRKVSAFFVYPLFDQRIFKMSLFKNDLERINEESQEIIIIKNVTIDISEMICKKARFVDYCKLAQKDNWEKFSITQLGKSLGRKGCGALAKKVNRVWWPNLSNSNISDFRFLRYFSNMRKVKVFNTFEDRLRVLERLHVRVIGLESQRNVEDELLFKHFFDLQSKSDQNYYLKFLF